jgi:hypothetical protein
MNFMDFRLYYFCLAYINTAHENLTKYYGIGYYAGKGGGGREFPPCS